MGAFITMKIMLIGSADLSGRKIGGQYEKTRLVYNFLKKEDGIEVNFCNMFDIGKAIGFVNAVVTGYAKCDAVIVITSSRGTKAISQILYFLKKVYKKVIIHLVVGNQQKLFRTFPERLTRTVDKLYFEVECMQEELKEKYNVGFFSNCKNVQTHKMKHDVTNPIRICYYSEISFRKGFDRLIRALDVINKDFIRYKLDVYGYFASDESDMRKYFDSRDYLSFKGVIKRESSQEFLSQYSFMVFPSRHKLEGVPGAIVDAYEAGLPVICSDVGFLPYVVKDRRTGLIFSDEESLIRNLSNIYNNLALIDDMRDDVFKEAQKYDIKKSVAMLHRELDEMVRRYR